MSTTWTLDYCIACERQTSGGAYCSQTCRLADLDPSLSSSEPSSPTDPQFTAWTTSNRSSTAGFFLPPAFNFSAYRSNPSSAPTSRPVSMTNFSSQTAASSALSYMTTLSQTDSSPRVLTPSSSRSSLTSVQSSSAGDAISSQARSNLQDYTNSFDQVRDWRRRRTTS